MIIEMALDCPKFAVTKVEEKLVGWPLKNLVSFDVCQNKMTLTIKKLGTSIIEFNIEKSHEKLIFKKSKEKIALSHKAIRNVVESKLTEAVRSIEGKIYE